MFGEPLTFEAARHVAANLRDADAEEIYAFGVDLDPDGLAAHLASGGSFAWSFDYDGAPACVLGATPLRPGVWSAWMLGTDDFPAIGAGVTKFVKRVMLPALRQSGAHRAECHTLASHGDAHRWLEACGAHREAEHLYFGRGGETFYTYALYFEDVHLQDQNA